MTNTLCKNCRWWQPRDQETKGECHVNPPMGLGFPLTNPHDWCGRAEAKPEEKAIPKPRK